MNLNTSFLGLNLRNPLIVGASPFSDDVHLTRQLQDAGAAALVMRSLFAEQSRSEAPDSGAYWETSERYLRQLAQLKNSLTIPVIASLNGSRPGGWGDCARLLASAGADAIELNLYQLVTDPAVSGDQVEAAMLENVHDLATAVKIPIAVKISAFHTAPAHFARALEHAGAAGLVVFNRLHQPDLDTDELAAQSHLNLSDASELLLRLRWLAILSPRLRISLAATGGVHSSDDAVKALLAGAHGVQLVSVLLRHGPRIISTLLAGLQNWMDEHGCKSIDALRGTMNLSRCADPAAFERANYQRILQSWRV